jgi:Ca2+-binding RTX toxin-like protein
VANIGTVLIHESATAPVATTVPAAGAIGLIADLANSGSATRPLFCDCLEQLVYAGPGSDRVFGGDRTDAIHGEGGADFLSGGGRWDHVWGGDGFDTLLGNEAKVTLRGEGGRDFLNGGDEGVRNDAMAPTSV